MHNHSHHYTQESQRIGWAFFLNVTFTIIEFIGGMLTNSTAIMADAVHDLGDSLSIGLAWVLSKLSHKKSTEEFSYGYRRFSLLGALINGFVLIIGSAWVLSEAIPKLFEPEMPVAEGMLGLAILGVAVNGFAAYKLSQGKTLNEKVLNWHLLEDVFGWVAVLIVSIILMFVDWPILDPALSIVFTLFILFNVVKSLWATIKLFLQAVPDKELLEKIRQSILSLKEIESVHHMHLWSLDGERHVLTAHVKLKTSVEISLYNKMKTDIQTTLQSHALAHTTIELELAEEQCRDQESSNLQSTGTN
jgi:cobalt-zinc-cadmium efflux system protein